MTELKNKPLSEWTLAEVKENCEKLENCEGCPFNFHPDYTLCALDDFPCGWSLPEKPRITEAELTICKAVGAKWVSKNPHECYVCLWEDKPVYADSEYKGKRLLGFFTEERFPGIRPGDLVCVDEANA